ncbi:MAG: tetratricopeptide repeat protein [Chthoniobacterales bacterium]
MRIRKIAVVTILVFSSFAATNVAPSKSELEAMYSRAFRDFDAGNFPQALKELDDIDARQPELAESQNLRGVILMRQGIYDKAEAALFEAVRIDPKFWNARFNLAEIPFLRKDWVEARNRFQQLLASNVSDLEGEAAQLIQYKLLLTYLLEGKENMVDAILAKFELSPDTPAVHYANAAIALQHKNTKEANDWVAAAQKNFSPQLNKLFAESLYEVGWLEKPAGQARASLPLTTAAERAAKSKGFARSRFEQAQQALQQRDLAAARKFIDEADASDPNQAPIVNLRGEILMAQHQFAEAETAFKKALKIDPKFREAQFNLADIPFKQGDYPRARERFEALFQQTPGGDKNQAAQIIKFKIYMSLLMEGKESRAQKMMEQFQFTGDTPALYYAQAAWEFKHNNPTKATDWVASAKKIYSPALNNLFGDAFYDLGWAQAPTSVAAVRPASEAAAAMSTQNESVPAIEPSPIPGVAAVTSKPAEQAVASIKPSTQPITGMEATTSRAPEPAVIAAQSPAIAANQSIAAGTPARPEEMPAAPLRATAPTVETPAAPQEPIVAQSSPAVEPAATVAASTPATVLAPARVTESPRASTSGTARNWLAAALLLSGVLILGWLVAGAVRQRISSISIVRQATPAVGPRVDQSIATADKPMAVARNGLLGGPRRISLQLKASEPSLRRGVLALGKPGRPLTATAAPVPAAAEPIAPRRVEAVVPKIAPVDEPIVEQEPVAVPAAAAVAPAEVTSPAFDFVPVLDTAPVIPAVLEIVEPAEATVASVAEPWIQSESEPVQPVAEPWIQSALEPVEPVAEPWIHSEPEPIPQGQPIPYQVPVAAAEPVMPEILEPPVFTPEIFPEPSVAQTNPIVTMPDPIQIPTAPVVRTPAGPGAPQPAGAMHTAVQLTFTFEIASMQLTPTFKMGALQVRPTSKIVTMRLAAPQQPQPGMNLQVTFEIAKIQPTGGALGTLRLTPSQQQRPQPSGSSSFTVAGLQLVPNFEAAPVQLTPSQQGQAPVLVTAPFQIATVEFSPSFEIASIVLNSTSKQVAVQLPGAGPSSGEAAPMFEIANLQLTGSGELGMMQLNLIGQGPRRA